MYTKSIDMFPRILYLVVRDGGLATGFHYIHVCTDKIVQNKSVRGNVY